MTIEISKEKYKDLLKQSVKLELLENAGVDNWQWYGDALNPEYAPHYDDLCDEIDEEINAL